MALGVYSGPLRDVILRLKHAESHALAYHLGLLLGRHAGSLLPQLPDTLVPVPMYWYRRFRRGINSVSILGQGVSRGLGVPITPDAVWSCRATRKQSQLSAAERLPNVRGAFRCRPGTSWKGRRIAIVDDTLTTGATCDELARVLRSAGASSVTVLVAARAVAEWKHTLPTRRRR